MEEVIAQPTSELEDDFQASEIACKRKQKKTSQRPDFFLSTYTHILLLYPDTLAEARLRKKVNQQCTVDFFHIFCFAAKHQAFITRVAKMIFRTSHLMIWHQK